MRGIRGLVRMHQLIFEYATLLAAERKTWKSKKKLSKLPRRLGSYSPSCTRGVSSRCLATPRRAWGAVDCRCPSGSRCKDFRSSDLDVSQIYDEDQLLAFFASCDVTAPSWVGDVFQITSGHEVIPFTFDGNRYLFLLGTPENEAGDQQTLSALCSEFADGFLPDASSRVVKFCRADAAEFHFDPTRWSLSKPETVCFTAIVSRWLRSLPSL